MLGVDTLTFALLVASLGDQGYLGIPFVIFAAAGYAMGHARAAWVQYLVACVVYPLARGVAMLDARGDASIGLVAVETLCLVTIGWDVRSWAPSASRVACAGCDGRWPSWSAATSRCDCPRAHTTTWGSSASPST